MSPRRLSSYSPQVGQLFDGRYLDAGRPLGRSKMAEEVQAETADLSIFVGNGASYVSRLQAIYDEVFQRRSTVISALGEGSPTVNANAVFGELINESVINNGFVEVIRDALEDFAGSESSAATASGFIDRALSDAGLLLDGTDLSAEQDALLAEGLQDEAAALGRLEDRIGAAIERGDFLLVADLQAELDEIILDGLDDETRSVLIVGRHFEDIFGSDRVEGDLEDRFAKI